MAVVIVYQIVNRLRGGPELGQEAQCTEDQLDPT